MVLVEVKRLWAMAGILTVPDKNLKKQMEALLKTYQSMKKDSITSRHTQVAEQRRIDWLENVESLFDCASAKAEESLSKSRFLDKDDKQEDLAFLEDQRSARQQWIG